MLPGRVRKTKPIPHLTLCLPWNPLLCSEDPRSYQGGETLVSAFREQQDLRDSLWGQPWKSRALRFLKWLQEDVTKLTNSAKRRSKGSHSLTARALISLDSSPRAVWWHCPYLALLFCFPHACVTLPSRWEMAYWWDLLFTPGHCLPSVAMHDTLN